MQGDQQDTKEEMSMTIPAPDLIILNDTSVLMADTNEPVAEVEIRGTTRSPEITETQEKIGVAETATTMETQDEDQEVLIAEIEILVMTTVARNLVDKLLVNKLFGAQF